MWALDIETSGLDPESCFITCIGFADECGLVQYSSPAASFQKDPIAAEESLLENFLSVGRSFADPLVSYNGLMFDLPFLQRRLAYHGKSIPKMLEARHIDLMAFVKHLDPKSRWIGKDEAIRRFSNIYLPKMSSGQFLSRLYTHQRTTPLDHLEMLQHNAIDVAAVYRLALFLQDYPDFTDFCSRC